MAKKDKVEEIVHVLEMLNSNVEVLRKKYNDLQANLIQTNNMVLSILKKGKVDKKER